MLLKSLSKFPQSGIQSGFIPKCNHFITAYFFMYGREARLLVCRCCTWWRVEVIPPPACQTWQPKTMRGTNQLTVCKRPAISRSLIAKWTHKKTQTVRLLENCTSCHDQKFPLIHPRISEWLTVHVPISIFCLSYCSPAKTRAVDRLLYIKGVCPETRRTHGGTSNRLEREKK